MISPASAFANLYVKVGGAGQIFHGLQDEKIESKDKGETLERKYTNTKSALFAVNWGYKINESIAVELAGGTSFMPIEYSKKKSTTTTQKVAAISTTGRLTVNGVDIPGGSIGGDKTTTDIDERDMKSSASCLLGNVVLNYGISDYVVVNANFGAGVSFISTPKKSSQFTESQTTKTVKSESSTESQMTTGLAWSVGFGANYKISDSLFAHAGYNFTHYGAHEYDTENILRAHVIGVGIGYNF